MQGEVSATKTGLASDLPYARMVTTQTTEEVEEIQAKGLTVYDHYVILDTEVRSPRRSLHRRKLIPLVFQAIAEKMTPNGIVTLTKVLQGSGYAAGGQAATPGVLGGSSIPTTKEGVVSTHLSEWNLPDILLLVHQAAAAVQYAIDHPDQAAAAASAAYNIHQNSTAPAPAPAMDIRTSYDPQMKPSQPQHQEPVGVTNAFMQNDSRV